MKKECFKISQFFWQTIAFCQPLLWLVLPRYKKKRKQRNAIFKIPTTGLFCVNNYPTKSLTIRQQNYACQNYFAKSKIINLLQNIITPFKFRLKFYLKFQNYIQTKLYILLRVSPSKLKLHAKSFAYKDNINFNNNKTYLHIIFLCVNFRQNRNIFTSKNNNTVSLSMA